MTLFFLVWALVGTAHWVDKQIRMPLPFGFVGDVLIGLPFCMIFGPIFMITAWVEGK